MALTLPGIGPKTEIKLKKLGIESKSDLLHHFPHRYLDFSKLIPISKIKENETCTISGQIIRLNNIFTRSQKNLQKIILEDSSGQIELIWFNQSYLIKNFHLGETWSFAGIPTFYKGRLTLFSPEYGQYHTGKIIPIYPETKGLSSRWFRKTFSLHLDSLLLENVDPLPLEFLKSQGLLTQKEALNNIHFPKNQKILDQSRHRLAIDEIFSLLATAAIKKKEWQQLSPSYILKENPQNSLKIKQLIDSLPFELTTSQKEAWIEIKEDLLSSNKLCNRLLCGDVGSGKTIIALLAAYLTSLNHYQSLLLAPTEILANQHYFTFKKFLNQSTPVYLLTAHSKIPQKLEDNSIIIATHAALFQSQKLKKIALLIIDEQHKFGVKQRSFLNQTSPPHTLTMSATPIPRSISLTYFGNLDLSTLKSPPQTRLPVKTFLVPKNKIPDCYLWLQSEIEQKHTQAFIVCPFIEESENLKTIKAAKNEFEKLKKIFPTLNLALIHGKTKSDLKKEILQKFQQNKINILVTTPIIEVGIDFPNATTIIIQSADHFGLSQLHQLRGRVGRGQLQSFCYFFSEDSSLNSQKRLQFLTKNHDGFKIAEYDLQTRGPGEIFSTLQHGFPLLKLAPLSNINFIESSKKLFNELQKRYPHFDLQKLIFKENNLTKISHNLN